MDALAALFSHAAPAANSFFVGTLCTTAQFAEVGHLHLLKRGVLTLRQNRMEDVVLSEPTLLFFPRGRAHSFLTDPEDGAELVCATVDFGGGAGSPISDGLPELVTLPLAWHPSLQPVCDLLMSEGFSDIPGRQAALDRLFDYLLILIVRHAID
ncbi:MAG: cupin domain-containing protein, partial [Beijerinckiaceae bacterium]